ncbi:3-oxoacyl-ACP reductase FabG [Marinomonas mediterranea]|jgi:Dehydrogenases with different specificities (related to short-chain alcohol dehydrogenases)|uniref:3-oxoacyl-(Acyl-carrier-protein) reductase n=1 Tax=Marinomonas mediterranea (strain ATCC 700492 / JCM 21426 / NBRC 103028 / MMB-1) TaxID=717774 RepID=F2JZT1_MARM1|nr:3-oxoacyl-ACP reductase FabG [Marinomonas mediterranea]ADZ90935.1 3-oxoacyl-(acyl-carrier-protein) reductase [Marinomonas mediterranea MMB-1]WCN13006.1 3-oxoacyl-ACP reductase FabG [Marinomonas mediterranea]WCN17079.1 3-oxoacyl-ACP reductase FabG [Marinomonas mediterranea MMB-1]
MFASLAGKVAIVTGGSKGIGKGIAKVFANQGVKIMIAARGEADAKKAVDEIVSSGGEADYYLCDVSSWDGVQGLLSKTIDTYGKLDILCANAGIFPQKKMADMNPDEWDTVMSTNLKSTFLAVKACIPYFEKSGQGRVIVTSSITGPITGYPGWSHYGASKAGQLGFIKTAAMELAPYNTTINAVMPGNIMTEGLADLGEDYLTAMASSIPMKRLGAVEDIGNAALFFATDEASYITGQQIVVDGGQILPESLDAINEM